MKRYTANNNIYRLFKRKTPNYTKRLTLVLSIFLISTGAYLYILSISPKYIARHSFDTLTDKYHTKDRAYLEADRIIIPRIGVDVEYSKGDANVLEKGAWWRQPAKGNPKIGGNFILSAHRFRLGWTPSQTRYNSPFYNLHKLVSGDEIFVFFDNELYKYKVAKTYEVRPTALDVEAGSDFPKLTLYSCTLKGQNDGRTVIEALPIELQPSS